MKRGRFRMGFGPVPEEIRRGVRRGLCVGLNVGAGFQPLALSRGVPGALPQAGMATGRCPSILPRPSPNNAGSWSKWSNGWPWRTGWKRNSPRPAPPPPTSSPPSSTNSPAALRPSAPAPTVRLIPAQGNAMGRRTQNPSRAESPARYADKNIIRASVPLRRP